jgi:hypothetical protein
MQVEHRLQTVRAELYNGFEDDVRFAFEIILSIWVFTAMLWTFGDVLHSQKTQGNFMKVSEGGVSVCARVFVCVCVCV